LVSSFIYTVFAGCKLSAVCLGYWCDPLLPLMVKRGERKAPEINLGYYARVMGVRLLIHKFFEARRLEDTNPRVFG
jgi:hypothetical protein